MVGTLLLRGMMAGLLAGLIAFGVAKIVGEPPVDRAIAFETALDKARGEAEVTPLVSRHVQSTIGLLTAVVVYGAALGGLYALVFAYLSGRVGRIGARGLAALLALAGFAAIALIPQIKYPANPPSVGSAETIGFRTGMYFLMILISVAAMAAAATAARPLRDRYGAWNGWLIAGAGFIAVIAAAQILLPGIDEVPSGFPADVLWRFRLAGLGIQLVLWTSLGLLFGWLTERSLQSRFRFIKPAAS